MKVAEMVSSISGRKLDTGEDGPRNFGGRLLYAGGKAETSEVIGVMREDVPASGTDWTAAMRAWSQPAPLTVEERLQALEREVA
jgi:hypothetical protein